MAHKSRKTIRKAAGHREEFDMAKLCTSLQRCGASPELAEQVAHRVYEGLEESATSGQLFRLAHNELRRIHTPTAMRYNLKRALFRLGPTGYPFEQYFSRILEAYGYRCRTNLMVQGRCVEHEVDVVAEDDHEVAAVECKYHNRGGRHTDVKVALYVQARMDDIGGVLAAGRSPARFVGWLVTNTRLTSLAIQYGRCMGLRLTGWRYPGTKGLEHLIEAKALYPITVLSGIKRGITNQLIKNGVVLLRELVDLGEEELVTRYRLGRRQAARLVEAVDELCRSVEEPQFHPRHS